ncbi:MAG: DNA translocase FtsK [Puniceicoccaceae bacterium]|nr:MAG: DNA translocase FtsK [Puniceicoccaceae bacterium]
MARSRSKTETTEAVALHAPRSQGNWLLATLAALLGLLVLVALLDYQPEQTRFITTDRSELNLVGIFGADTAWVILYTLGGAGWLVPVFLFWSGWIFHRRGHRRIVTRFLAMIGCLICASALLAMQARFFTDQANAYHQGPGGVLGGIIYGNLLETFLGTFGSAIILGGLGLVGLVYVVTKDVPESYYKIRDRLGTWFAAYAKRRQEIREARRLAAEEAKARAAEPTKKLRRPQPESDEATEEDSFPPPKPAAPVRIARNGSSASSSSPGTELKIVAPEETRKAKQPARRSAGAYRFPELNLLDAAKGPSVHDTREEHARNAETLLRVLAEFGVEVTLGEIHTGPVITRYEVYPAPGVRVEKISGLDKNIAMGMEAQSVRILAPVPGKGCVGVEVPNRHPAPVGIREILESEDWASSKAEIPIALGRDVSGKPLISDLTRMPHLLIAGTTGSGKTVCINSIITSLLYHASPETLRFIMVDPKIVEMKQFNDLPHMLIPVVTEPKKVPAALKWLLAEMNRRYEIFAKVGVRNIAGFNGRKKLEAELPGAPSKDQLAAARDPGELDFGESARLEIPDKLPYIVCIIDELADLMMVAPAEVETGIARLAQLARAAGIHLIIATQRPSVNVITGVIKANLPCRIAFQVAVKVDSRTILDTGGAEQLIGRGDMLFSPPGTSRLIRSQGAFVSDDELNRVVDFLKVNGPPVYAEEVQQQIDQPEGAEIGDEDDDALIPDALEVLRSTKRASTSMLQRRLKIGYTRAARIMEQLESKGIVGPENGSSPREILVDPDSL